MKPVHADTTFLVDPATGEPNYDRGNSLIALSQEVARLRQGLFAAQSAYLGESLQFLLPYQRLELYGPAGDTSWRTADPRMQDDKEDFQKQNVRSFDLGDTALVRGWVRAGDDTVPFLRISYRGGPDSRLARQHGSALGSSVRLWVRVGSVQTPGTVAVPYDPESESYAIEFWGAANPTDTSAREAVDTGALVVDPELMWGRGSMFTGENVIDEDVRTVQPDHPMHPLNPLTVECAWSDATGSTWDSKSGRNHRFCFAMKVRGWTKFLKAGVSSNPHGGVGFLDFRNLFSNYFGFARHRSDLAEGEPTELGRRLEDFQTDAHGTKGAAGRMEDFMAVDYMDLHSVHVDAGIGLHRHRDNSEVFFMLDGQALMVIGDWLEHPERSRAFEARSLSAGELALLKGGQLHGLLNLGDSPSRLFMFGGYD